VLLLTEHNTIKACWESIGIAPHILDLDTRWKWVVSFTLRPLYPQGKSSCYSLDKRLGGPQSRSGRCGEEKNSQPLPGLEHRIIQPVAQCYTTELSRLLKGNCRFKNQPIFLLSPIQNVKIKIYKTVILPWTNCTFGFYPSSGVSKNWGIKNIYTKHHNTHVHKIHTRVNY
jgi:hypothetical protein